MTAMLGISVFVSAAPQEDADRIIGTYLATYEGEESKVSIFKEDDGTYTARVIWVLNKYDENGNVKTDEKNPDKVDFYVSYEAQVEAGIDFSAIEIHMEGKTITVDLPEARINDVSVDISSMDFMFFNDRANTSTVSERAYKACEKDVQAESENQGAILELAHQNAQNVIRALVQPVIEPMGEEYELVVN